MTIPKAVLTDVLPWPDNAQIEQTLPMIANGSFGPDEIKVMTAAYEGALVDLNVTNRDDPLTELIAKAIVNVTATGERDPVLVKDRAINALGVRRPTAA
jgi:hypothetical protein